MARENSFLVAIKPRKRASFLSFFAFVGWQGRRVGVVFKIELRKAAARALMRLRWCRTALRGDVLNSL